MVKYEKLTLDQKRKIDIRHFPARPHVGVGGIIKWKDEIILIKRKYNPSQGKWAIPGGHLEVGERLLEGAIRECEEETGLKVKYRDFAAIIERIDEITPDSDQDETKIEYHYVLIDYFLDVDDEIYSDDNPPIPIAQSDVLEAKFVPIAELLDYDLTSTVIELFKKVNFV